MRHKNDIAKNGSPFTLVFHITQTNDKLNTVSLRNRFEIHSAWNIQS